MRVGNVLREVSLLNVHLGGWEIALYTYPLRAFFRQTSECTLRMPAEIYSVLEAYLHTIQEAIGQECKKWSLRGILLTRTLGWNRSIRYSVVQKLPSPASQVCTAGSVRITHPLDFTQA